MVKQFKDRRTKGKNKIKVGQPASSTDTQKLKPVFLLRCDHADFCVGRHDRETKADFAHTIHDLSLQTWQQIDVSSRGGQGYETITHAQFKPDIPKDVTPDMNIKVFRLSDAKRMAGVRRGHVFEVLFVSDKHNLY